MIRTLLHKLNLPASELTLMTLGAVAYIISAAWLSVQLENPVLPLLALVAVGVTLRQTLKADDSYIFMLILTFSAYGGVSLFAAADGARRGDPFGAVAVLLGGALIQAAGNAVATRPMSAGHADHSE